MEFFDVTGDFLGNGIIPIKRYSSKESDLKVYFVDMDSQVINGYFCYGVDQPECSGIETMLSHLDSSGGLLPRGLRSDILRPTWQHHGVENPLADRDQSCYVCCALGETAFLGTFPCCTYLLRNIEAIFDFHGCEAPSGKKGRKAGADEDGVNEGGEPGQPEDAGDAGSVENDDGSDKDSEYESDATEPNVKSREFYFLGEAGEGAMAWEATLQSMFPGVRAFWNRLLCDAKSKVGPKMRECFDNFYRPDNLTVIITGTLNERKHVLETLRDYEQDYKRLHPDCAPFSPPWNEALPPREGGVTNDIKFVPRNPKRDPLGTLCLGWRGCDTVDLETSLALKVFTAHAAVGPLWTEFVTSGLAHRISWCQLEYKETCSLVTIHGISSDANTETVVNGAKSILARMHDQDSDFLKLEDLRAMVDRIGWHYVRELEAEPFLVLAAGISKGERFGKGDLNQIEKRVHPRSLFQTLMDKPLEYWRTLASQYFRVEDTFVTKVSPTSYAKEDFPSTPVTDAGVQVQSEETGEQTFADSSRRASSRFRRKADSSIQDHSRTVADLSKDFASTSLGEEPKGEKAKEAVAKDEKGHLEELIKLKPFPFDGHMDEVEEFNNGLEITAGFLKEVGESSPRYFPIKTYKSSDPEQHSLFPINDMPFATFLEDLETSFVYITFVIDTTHLSPAERKLVGPITAALGAVLCPRPPGLDSDLEITNPTEFNPPKRISDSQISLGLNGELMQCVFALLVALPENYEWTIRMFHYVLYEMEFSESFLAFIGSEAVKGLAANYKMQTAEEPNYNCFDSTEINLHSLVKQLYKQESNSRLFVGRRRLDLINEYVTQLKGDPKGVTGLTNATWRKLVDQGKINLQVAANVGELSKICPDPVAAWKEVYAKVQKPENYDDALPILERELMNQPCGEGIAVSINQPRPPCLSTAIPINANNEDFPKLCLAAQLFSMAQKWVWTCLMEEDTPQPVLRMPSPYSNMLTMSVDSADVIGALEVLKLMMNTEWAWLEPMLTAAKLMIVNDPASVEMGPQSAIGMALLAHLSKQPLNFRRDLVMDSLRVTIDDLKEIVTKYLIHLFNPKKCWYALTTYNGGSNEDEAKIMAGLKELGFNLKKADLLELCTTL